MGNSSKPRSPISQARRFKLSSSVRRYVRDRLLGNGARGRCRPPGLGARAVASRGQGNGAVGSEDKVRHGVVKADIDRELELEEIRLHRT